MIELASDLSELRPRIVVIGVGGAGGNAVASMMANGVKGVDFVVANTDAQALHASPAPRIIQLGSRTTQGLGAGSRADIGKAAAEESIAEIERVLEGAHMCFIAAGMGGGTGTGATPVIAKLARAKGILTFGVVSKPFAFEGARRAAAAEAGLRDLQDEVDTLIVIPNQNLFRIANPDTTFRAAFDLADEVLQQGVRGITDLMVMSGLINLDFADVRSIMSNRGKAMMGAGEATGEDRAIRAVEQAINNPLLDDALQGARGLIISISGGDDLRLMEVDEVANHIKDLVNPEADIIWGSAFNPALQGRIRVSVFATGIDLDAEARSEAARPAPVTAAAASTARIAALRPTEGFYAPLVPPTQLDLGLAPVARTGELELTEAELLLTVERVLVLVPPAGAGEIPTIDPFNDEPVPAPRLQRPSASPSLFERIAMAARGAREAAVADVLPDDWVEQRIARRI
jgi:cell division protein FtsZ